MFCPKCSPLFAFLLIITLTVPTFQTSHGKEKGKETQKESHQNLKQNAKNILGQPRQKGIFIGERAKGTGEKEKGTVPTKSAEKRNDRTEKQKEPPFLGSPAKKLRIEMKKVITQKKERKTTEEEAARDGGNGKQKQEECQRIEEAAKAFESWAQAVPNPLTADDSEASVSSNSLGEEQMAVGPWPNPINELTDKFHQKAFYNTERSDAGASSSRALITNMNLEEAKSEKPSPRRIAEALRKAQVPTRLMPEWLSSENQKAAKKAQEANRANYPLIGSRWASPNTLDTFQMIPSPSVHRGTNDKKQQTNNQLDSQTLQFIKLIKTQKQRSPSSQSLSENFVVGTLPMDRDFSPMLNPTIGQSSLMRRRQHLGREEKQQNESGEASTANIGETTDELVVRAIATSIRAVGKPTRQLRFGFVASGNGPFPYALDADVKSIVKLISDRKTESALKAEHLMGQMKGMANERIDKILVQIGDESSEFQAKIRTKSQKQRELSVLFFFVRLWRELGTLLVLENLDINSTEFHEQILGCLNALRAEIWKEFASSCEAAKNGKAFQWVESLNRFDDAIELTNFGILLLFTPPIVQSVEMINRPTTQNEFFNRIGPQFIVQEGTDDNYLTELEDQMAWKQLKRMGGQGNAIEKLKENFDRFADQVKQCKASMAHVKNVPTKTMIMLGVMRRIRDELNSAEFEAITARQLATERTNGLAILDKSLAILNAKIEAFNKQLRNDLGEVDKMCRKLMGGDGSGQKSE
ncbi:hypothetical protein niasHS_011965 [Heterodera schachtii]|uniref:FH2 domain-containing protein n=1 Tax=Heterodera schachtii TaxID=97005 RepID=A0ABD2IGZ2_HETSC